MRTSRNLVILSRSFGKASEEPFRYLEENNIQYKISRNSTPENVEFIAKEIGDAQAVIVGSDIISEYVMDRCPNLRLVSKQGVGLDSVDLDLAKVRNIKVTNTPDANNESVADLCLLFMLYLSRKIGDNLIKSKTPNWETKNLSNDLYGKTVGLVGFGQIGQATARRLQGFDCKVLVHDPYIQTSALSTQYVETVDLDTLFKESQILSLHMPATPETKHFINESSIAKLQPGVMIINTSRGALIDEDVLYKALKDGRIGSAGLDVFAMEPPVDNPILILPNVICTPHIAPHTVEANYRMGMAAAQNVVNFFNENM